MARRRRDHDRFLATVLFTDIADSTRIASELGDGAWRDLLDQHHELIRRQLRAFGGREIDTAGDGFFAAFDAPARAVACALTVAELVPALGIRIRAGIHMGEVEETGGKLSGIAVHIGSRIAAAAEPGQVLTSATVRDLVYGSGIEFDDQGLRALKGVPDEWRIYAARKGPTFAPEFLPSDGTATREVAAVRRTMSRRARRRRLTVIVAAVSVVALAGTAALVFFRVGPSLAHVDANTAAVIDVGSGQLIAEVAVGARPDGIAYGEGAVWVANSTDGTVSRIDPASRTMVQSIEVGSAPSGLAVGFGSVWVADSGDRTVMRINAGTNKVVQTITVGNGPTAVAVGSDAVWVANSIDGTLSRIDPATSSVSATIPVGVSPVALAADGTAVWIANLDTGTVSRVEPSSDKVIASISVGNGPRAVAIGEGAVWVANSIDGTVSRIDPATDRVTAIITAGEGASGLVTSAGHVWVTSASDGAVYRIDTGTNSVSRIVVGSSPQDVTLAAGQVWFSARSSAASHRGGTVRVVSSNSRLSSLDSLDPAISFTGVGWALLGMTNDGLVTFDRVGGIQGATVLADLAVSIPRPTDGGTSYTFQVRPGLTYSDGQPIRAQDFRYAMERVFDVPPSVDLIGGLPYYQGIVGVDACIQVQNGCDLSRGIVTDDAANTVTIHLKAADPDFLYKLALPFADAVPASVGKGNMGDHPVPATGPYMFVSVSDDSIKLARNPRFHEWSRAARPDGYPDEITWSLKTDVGTQLEMLLNGSADAMVDPPEVARIDDLRTRFPSQLHSTARGTTFVFMNTSVAPFDDVRVRQAVNLAVDRRKVVDLLGGPLTAQVSCQFLPPNSPGYVPYCPYTINPDPVGTWTAPDVAKARELVAASGKAGTRVTVEAVPRFAAASAHVVDVLRQLGFDAAIHDLADIDALLAETLDPVTGPSIQAGVVAWIPDYPAASADLVPTFDCAEGTAFTHLCDPDTQALIQKALELQQTDPVAAGQTWSAVDRRIVDLAPVAVLANDRLVDFVSSRVGNYQNHPQWGVLYDQLWVQ